MRNCRFSSSTLLILLAAIAFGALFFTVPRMHDDYWYMRGLADFGRDPSGAFSFLRGVVETAKEHHLHDNSRIPNLLGAVLVSLPLWLLALISTASVWFALKMMVRLSGSSSFVSVTFLVMAFTFFVPWRDMLFTGMFTYNYIWPCALLTLAIYLFIRKEQTGSGWMFLTGIILGAWHEAYSFPALLGAILCFALHRRMLRRDRIWLCIGLFVGGLWLWLSPSRQTSTGFASYITMGKPWRDMIADYWFPAIYCLFWAFSLLRSHSARKEALAPVSVIAVTYCAVCLPVYLLSGALRSTTPAIVMSAVGIAFLLRHNIPQSNRWLNALGIAAWIFFGMHMVAAFITGLKIRSEEHEIISQYEISKDTADGVVFADVTTYRDAPWLSLGKPYQALYTYYSHSALVGKYYHAPWPKVIPSAVRNFSTDDGRRIEGDRPYWEYKGYIVAKELDVNPFKPIIGVKVAYGSPNAPTSDCGVFAHPFKANDSEVYVYLSVADAENVMRIEIP